MLSVWLQIWAKLRLTFSCFISIFELGSDQNFTKSVTMQYAASIDRVRWDKCHAWQSQLVFWLSCWKFWNMSLTQLYIPMCSKTQDGSTSKINCQIWFSVVPYPAFVPSICSYAVTVYVLNLGFLCILQ